MTDVQQSPYEWLGKYKGIETLIETFYGYVAEDPVLSPLFPADLTETARKQKQFLTQFFGGPALYTEEHGHPMLRARHMPFPIEEKHARAWLACMTRAMQTVGLKPDLQEFLLSRLTLTAYHMVNTENTRPGKEQ